MRDEAGHDQDVELAASKSLIRQMRAFALYITRRWRGIGRRRRGWRHQRLGRSFRRYPKLVAQPLGQRRMLPRRRASIAGQQQAADQMPSVHLAVRIELDQPSRVRSRGKMIAGGILVLHE